MSYHQQLFTKRQLATILGALRAYQASPPFAREIDMIAVGDIVSDGSTITPLTDEEIDAFCEALNFGDVCAT